MTIAGHLFVSLSSDTVSGLDSTSCTFLKHTATEKDVEMKSVLLVVVECGNWKTVKKDVAVCCFRFYIQLWTVQYLPFIVLVDGTLVLQLLVVERHYHSTEVKLEYEVRKGEPDTIDIFVEFQRGTVC